VRELLGGLTEEAVETSGQLRFGAGRRMFSVERYLRLPQTFASVWLAKRGTL
jgi:hypothetical protein